MLLIIVRYDTLLYLFNRVLLALDSTNFIYDPIVVIVQFLFFKYSLIKIYLITIIIIDKYIFYFYDFEYCFNT